MLSICLLALGVMPQNVHVSINITPSLAFQTYDVNKQPQQDMISSMIQNILNKQD